MNHSTQLNSKLAAAVALSLFVVTGVGLFGIQYSHHRSDANLKAMSDLNEALDRARRAQVAFKIQVQEWKNILIRGQNSKDFENYQAQFLDQINQVRSHLEAVQSSGYQTNAIAVLISEHGALNTSYQEALTEYRATEPATIFKVDAAVRGQDRNLNTLIDRLAEDLAKELDQMVAVAQTDGQRLYGKMRNALVVVSMIALAMAGTLTVRVSKLRET